MIRKPQLQREGGGQALLAPADTAAFVTGWQPVESRAGVPGEVGYRGWRGPAQHASSQLQPTPDEQLIARVQQGDRAAFAVLVERHFAPLSRYAARVSSHADGEDVAQEALLRVWQRAHSWQPHRVRFTTWLYRIAHNLCIDAYRRQHGETLALPDAGDGVTLDAAAAETRSADGALQSEQVADRVAGALMNLPERQRSAMALCFYQGFSNQQAADILDVSVDALESLLARGRRALRSELIDLAPADRRARHEEQRRE